MNKSPIILATAGYDKQIKFWDISKSTTIESKSSGDNAVTKLCLSHDGKYLGACTHGHVKVYDVRHLEQQERTFDGLNGNAVAMEFQQQNNWFFVACEDGTINIFDFKTQSANTQGYQRKFENGGVMIHCAVLHPNEVEIIFGDQNGEIKVWDL